MAEGPAVSPTRKSFNISSSVVYIQTPERPTQTDLLLHLIENVAKLEDYRIKDRKSDFGTALSVIHSWLPRESRLPPDSIRDIAFKLLRNEEQMYPIGSLLLTTASFDLAMQGSLRNETLLFVEKIAHDVRRITKNLPLSCSGFGRQKAWECGIDILKKMSVGLLHRSSIPDALKSQANCLANLSDIYASEGNADGAIAYGKESVDLLNRYSDRPEKCRIYGFSLYNVAWAYYSKGDNGKSLNYYSKALRAFEKAMDMHEDDKKEWIRKTRIEWDRARNNSK